MCRPEPHCPQCRGEVVIEADKAIRHQVFDLPQITPEVTEYLRLRGVCSGCGHKHHGALPVGVPNGQLGPRALALVGTLSFLERIFSTVQTCALQGRQTFDYLQEVMKAWLAKQTAPSLVPEHVLARQAACA